VALYFHSRRLTDDGNIAEVSVERSGLALPADISIGPNQESPRAPPESLELRRRRLEWIRFEQVAAFVHEVL
jgi:hypothetical protein